MSASVVPDEIVTKSGERMWVSVTVSDWTGTTKVHFSDTCAHVLYDCETSEEVLEKARKNLLRVTKFRLNCRGVIRMQDGGVRKIVVDAKKSSLISQISSASMRMTKGLSAVLSDVAQVAPVNRLEINEMSGMAVLSDGIAGEQETQPCNRVYLLLQGTEDSKAIPIDPSAPFEDQAFHVTSAGAKCLLSDDEVSVDLVGYCTYDSMPKFCLHRNNIGFVAVSNIQKKEDGRWQVSVEDIEPVSKADVPVVKKSLELEWKTALTKVDVDKLDSYHSPAKPEFWHNGPPKKVRRLDSDPMTPERKQNST